MKDMLKMGSLEYSNRLNLLLMTETDIEKIIKSNPKRNIYRVLA